VAETDLEEKVANPVELGGKERCAKKKQEGEQETRNLLYRREGKKTGLRLLLKGGQ